MNLVVQGPHMTADQAATLAGLAGSTRLFKIQEHAWRVHNAAPADEIPEYCAKQHIDYAFVPEGRRFADLRLLAMDMDSTLITIECIDELGGMAGKKAEVAEITAQAMRGELDYPGSLRKRVSLLAGLDERVLQEVYDTKLALTPGAEALVAACKRNGTKLLLVSGGFTYFVERLKARLGIDYAICNTLEIEDGRLTGRLLGDIVDAQAKMNRFCEVARALGAAKEETIAIGDGANDLRMMSEAGLSVAFHAKPLVRERADCAINWCGLDAVTRLLE